MEIKLDQLLIMQEKLDKNIESKFSIEKSDVISEKKLALIVELCEMINVNKCFKYWSQNKNIDKNKLGDEFVDCLHFILSLYLYYGVTQTEFIIDEKLFDEKQLTNKMLELIQSVNNINDSQACILFIYNLFSICKTLGFNSDEIINFYINKNNINHSRQEQNY